MKEQRRLKSSPFFFETSTYRSYWILKLRVHHGIDKTSRQPLSYRFHFQQKFNHLFFVLFVYLQVK